MPSVATGEGINCSFGHAFRGRILKPLGHASLIDENRVFFATRSRRFGAGVLQRRQLHERSKTKLRLTTSEPRCAEAKSRPARGFLSPVAAGLVGLAEHRIGCGEKGGVIVVAKATEEVPRFAERAPHEQICGEMVGRVAAVTAAG